MLVALIALRPESVVAEREPPMMIGLSVPPAAADRLAAVAPRTAEAAEPEPAPVPVPPPMPSQTPIEEPRPPVDPEPLTPQFDAEPDPATTGDAAGVESAAGAAGAACPMVASLQAALEGDVRALSALASIPRTSRSVANAVMLWDGGWIAPQRAGGAAVVDAIRNAVASMLAQTSDDCRTQTNLGPVFVPVRSEAGTTILAIGSGAWRWIDVLQDPAAAPRRTDVPD